MRRSLANPTTPVYDSAMISAYEAFSRLRDGNQRFVEGTPLPRTSNSAEQREELLGGQTPFAVVLGCSDSRVPVEMVFDQGFGDLFVIRVAGNVVASSQIGSVEFAAEQFGVRLVVVLGHTQCGAVEATIDALKKSTGDYSKGLRSIVDRIRPAVESLMFTDLADDREELSHEAMRSNVRMSANALRHGSEILEHLIGKKGLAVVGAEYCLRSGTVNFFDGIPKSLAADNAAVVSTNGQGTVPGNGLLVSFGGKVRQLWVAIARMLNINK